MCCVFVIMCVIKVYKDTGFNPFFSIILSPSIET
jgi:hypothetical protein